MLFKRAISLKQERKYVESFKMLRGMYETSRFTYEQLGYTSTEVYVRDKVSFFVNLAELSLLVRKEAAQSIPYIDEAIILLQTYKDENALKDTDILIQIEVLERLKKDYVEKAMYESR